MDDFLDLLEQHGGDDIVISYADVSNFFPTDNPHEDSFDYNCIDHRSLFEWADENGWKVTPLSDEAPDNAPHSPPVRFQKL